MVKIQFEKWQFSLEIYNNLIKNGKNKNTYMEYRENKRKLYSNLNAGEVYAYDIQYCKKYKQKYSEHKELAKKVQGLKGKDVTKYNQKLRQLNEELHFISKFNSNERLRYKLRFAFAFLLKNYRKKVSNKKNSDYTIDIEKFMNEFNVDC